MLTGTTEKQQPRKGEQRSSSGWSLPEETFPGREVCALEESVLQNAFHTTQGLDHVCAVVVEVPELAVMPLVCPPERVLLQNLENEVRTVTLLSAYHPYDRDAKSYPDLEKSAPFSTPYTWYCLKSVRTRQPLS